jgi:ribulose-5-phosphate 4-epimerase/fuculose-1-phosphate aldolase
MQGKNVRADLARVCRILAATGLMDLWGHASLRVPASQLIAVTPRFRHDRLPRLITEDDILICDWEGNVVEGKGELPVQFAVDVALYRNSQAGEPGACIFASPQAAMAAAISGHALRPITHFEANIAFGMATWTGERLALDPAGAAPLAKKIAGATAVHQSGVGVWTAGTNIYNALMKMYGLEYQTRANLLMREVTPKGSALAQKDIDKFWRQFAGHQYVIEFFDSHDPGPMEHPYVTYSRRFADSDDPLMPLKVRMAFTCKALWERGTLVAYLEHISHRLPGDRLLISAAKTFRDIEPGDMCLIDFKANWIDGPKPPNFKWFHSQLIAERPDVKAIVHTLELLGRVYALAGARLEPVHRVGLAIAMKQVPVYPHCDLILDADVRRATLDLLADGSVVHEIGHGTDFVADTLEKATADAIQREAYLALYHLAGRFGKPQPMPQPLMDDVLKHEPTAEDWWWAYAGEVGTPKHLPPGSGL